MPSPEPSEMTEQRRQRIEAALMDAAKRIGDELVAKIDRLQAERNRLQHAAASETPCVEAVDHKS